MLDAASTPFSLGILALLSLVLVVGFASRGSIRVPPYLRYLWVFFLLLSVADWVSFRIAAWLFAAFSFVALREYFSMVDIRLQDRWGILGAYLSIAFMTYFIYDWYGMFIISIPVYTFVLIPFLIALGGGETRGTVLSIGLIDLGLFLFVYSMGHIAYLAFFSVRIAMLFVLAVALSDLVFRLLPSIPILVRYVLAVVGTGVFALAVSPWTGVPQVHSAVLGVLIPFLVACGGFTIRVVEEDLGVSPETIEPGRGLLLNSLRAYLLPALIVFHYLRWFLHWGDL